MAKDKQTKGMTEKQKASMRYGKYVRIIAKGSEKTEDDVRKEYPIKEIEDSIKKMEAIIKEKKYKEERKPKDELIKKSEYTNFAIKIYDIIQNKSTDNEKIADIKKIVEDIAEKEIIKKELDEINEKRKEYSEIEKKLKEKMKALKSK